MHTVCIYNAYVAYAFNQNTIQYNRCVCVCALSAHVLFQRILRRTKTSHNVEIVYAIPTPQFISLCVVHGVDANTQMDNGMCGIVTPTHTQTNIYECVYPPKGIWVRECLLHRRTSTQYKRLYYHLVRFFFRLMVMVSRPPHTAWQVWCLPFGDSNEWARPNLLHILIHDDTRWLWIIWLDKHIMNHLAGNSMYRIPLSNLSWRESNTNCIYHRHVISISDAEENACSVFEFEFECNWISAKMDANKHATIHPYQQK